MPHKHWQLKSWPIPKARVPVKQRSWFLNVWKKIQVTELTALNSKCLGIGIKVCIEDKLIMINLTWRSGFGASLQSLYRLPLKIGINFAIGIPPSKYSVLWLKVMKIFYKYTAYIYPKYLVTKTSKYKIKYILGG